MGEWRQTLYDPHLHLFVDDHEIQEMRNVERVQGQPVKHPTPLIAIDRPWEQGKVAQMWGSVLPNPETGRLQMWYYVAESSPTPREAAMMCYAESADGLHWEKPDLGLYAYKGSRDNNICLWGSELGAFDHIDGACVARDDRDPDPNARYKMTAALFSSLLSGYTSETKYHGVHLFTSPDGKRWSMPPRLLMAGIGDANRLVWDPIRQLWILMIITSTVIEGIAVRTDKLSTSKDLHTWSDPKAPFAFTEEDDRGLARQYHWFLPFAYGNQYLAFWDAISSRSGFVEPYLCSSRDGETWDRLFGHAPLIPRGPEGAFDEIGVNIGALSPPILQGERMLMYYTGRTVPPEAKLAAIGLASLKRDRFVGLQSGSLFKMPEAVVTTKPVPVTGSQLYVNLRTFFGYSDVGPHDGTIKVELCDESYQPIAGFTRADCAFIKGDDVRHLVRWQGKENVSALRGQRVSARFLINRAALYSYQFA